MCVCVCAIVIRVCVINVIMWKRSFLKMKVSCSGSLHPCNSHVCVCVCVPSGLEPPPILAPGASQDRPLPFFRWRLPSLASSDGLFLKTPFKSLSWSLLQRFPYRQDPWRKNLQFSGLLVLGLGVFSGCLRFRWSCQSGKWSSYSAGGKKIWGCRIVARWNNSTYFVSTPSSALYIMIRSYALATEDMPHTTSKL